MSDTCDTGPLAHESEVKASSEVHHLFFGSASVGRCLFLFIN